MARLRLSWLASGLAGRSLTSMPIADILASGDFAQLVGMLEGTDLEVKSELYDLTTAGDRYELAKDVAAMANSEGGHLLIGLTTDRRQQTAVEVIDGLTLIPAGQFNAGQYEGIIRSHLYPPIDGLVVQFYPATNGTAGIGAIYVPQQDDDRKPFLTAKVVEDGELLKETIVSYSQRIDDDNVSFVIRELHRAFRKGRDSDSQRLTRMEEKLDGLLQDRRPSIRERLDRRTLDARIVDLLRGGE